MSDDFAVKKSYMDRDNQAVSYKSTTIKKNISKARETIDSCPAITEIKKLKSALFKLILYCISYRLVQ